MKSSENNDKILKIFVPLYAIGLLFQLVTDLIFNTTNVSESCSVLARNGIEPSYIYFGIIGGLILSTAAQFFKKYLWIIPAILFFFFFRDFVTCQNGPEEAYTPWNHAIVFWILLTLGLQKYLGSSRTVFLIKFYILFSYFAGGIAKLRNGLEWMNGKTLQYYFLRRTIDLDLPYAWSFVSNISLAKFYSMTTVVLEILIPLAFFSRKIEWLYVAGMVIFHIFCWYVLKLRWMNYYGWSYLIYFSIILEMIMHRTKKDSLKS